MADKDGIGSITDDDVQGDIDVKSERRVSFLPVLLKWIGIILAATIFIVAVVLVTLQIMNKRGKGLSEYPTSPEYRDNREMLQYYKGIGQIKTMTSDSMPATVIVEVNLGYTEDDKTTSQELSGRIVELKDFLRSYFSNKTIAELENEENVKIELRNLINDNVLSRGKIRSVAILQMDIIRQE
ncbi:MAG: flagellar basal body protein FliL [Treponema sp.]|nr:MAG: flagellar basal body protein FliL [Treponema sp.]